MGAYIDPAWEYWEPDPEIAELLASSGPCRDPMDRLRDDRLDRAKLSGVRFGKGSPDRPCLKLAPKRPDRARPGLSPRECKVCGVTFRPDRASRTLCGLDCHKKHRGRGGARSLSAIPCASCDKAFRPARSSRRFCSPACAARAQRKADAASGCLTCGDLLPPPRSKNGTARKFCSRKCRLAHAMRRRRLKEAGRETLRAASPKANRPQCSSQTVSSPDSPPGKEMW